MPDRSKEPLPARVEHRIRATIELAQRYRAGKEPAPAVPFVTVSRQYGCEAMEFAHALSEKLAAENRLPPGHWQVYNRQIIEAITAEVPLAENLIESLDVHARSGLEEFFQTLMGSSPPDIEVLKLLARVVRALAHHGNCILVGRGGALMTHDLPYGIHVRLVAPESWRLNSLITRFGWDKSRAHSFLHEEDTNRSQFYRKYLNRDVNDPLLYDIILNVSRINREEQVEAAAALCRKRFPRLPIEKST